MADNRFLKFLFPRQPRGQRSSRWTGIIVASLLIAAALFSLPSLLQMDINSETSTPQTPFPVTVNPQRKIIIQDPAVNQLLEGDRSSLTATAIAGIHDLIGSLASLVASIPWYQALAGADTHFVTIYPGFRQEQVASSFGKALGWTPTEERQFLTSAHTIPPVLTEGEFEPGTYVVSGAETPRDVQRLLYQRFDHDVLQRYSSSTAELVPMNQALTIASILQREAGSWDDMREISGILWNRIFNNMNLQVDATLQYAKSTQTDGKNGWWPRVLPHDKFIQSAYNTYVHPGLPPAPISNPSVAAVLAALNPAKTDCLFYFHDKSGAFHCSATYEEHVALLKKYYGQGK